MSVDPIGSTSAQAITPASGAPSNWQSDWEDVLNAAATALGTSTTNVQEQLESGSSLGSIASTDGVSQQTLVDAVASALQQSQDGSTSNGSTAGGGSPSAQLQQVATNMVNGTAGQHHHHHHHRGGVSPFDALSDTSATDGDGSTDGGATAAATALSAASDNAALAALAIEPTTSAGVTGAATAGLTSGPDQSAAPAPSDQIEEALLGSPSSGTDPNAPASPLADEVNLLNPLA